MAPARSVSLVLATSLALAACGGSPPAPAEPTPAPAAPVEPPPEPAAEPQHAPQPEPAADASHPATNPDTEASSGNEQREIKYYVSPDGLRVEIAGVQFTPTAEAVRVGGGWGVKVQVAAKARDGKPHSLLAPKGGEIAFAGTVTRAKGDPEEFGDERSGDDALTLEGDKSQKLTRTWPAKGGPKPVAAGDELALSIGIWGVGDDASSRRPVRKLALVTLKVDKGKGKATVKPPEGAGK